MEKQQPHCPSSTCPLDPLLPTWILLLASFISIKSYGPLGTARPGGPTSGPPQGTSESRCFSRLRSWNPREQSFRSPCSSCLLNPGLSLRSPLPTPHSFRFLLNCLPNLPIPLVPRYQVSQKEIQVGVL